LADPFVPARATREHVSRNDMGVMPEAFPRGKAERMASTIFFSWQSDIKAAACRTLIEDALKNAAAKIGHDQVLNVEPVIDRDTQGVAGSPDIADTIFEKIEAASVFVADVTIVGLIDGGRPTPNPNVLIELGYALKTPTLGWNRIVLVQNIAFGGQELLPFDLRQKRVMSYSSAVDAPDRASERRVLGSRLEEALRAIFKEKVPARSNIELTIDFRKKHGSSGDVHHYDLVPLLKNIGTKRLDDWEVEIEIPTPLLEPNTGYANRVSSRSDSRRSLFRAGKEDFRQPLRPGDQREILIPYRWDREIYDRREELFPQLVTARALINGEIVENVSKTVKELQDF